MATPPQILYSAQQVRELDRRAIQQYQISGIELMQRAGAAAYSILCKKWPQARNLAVICGTGNNAGDGYILASLAHQEGKKIQVFTLIAPDRLQGDAKLAYQMMRQHGLTTAVFHVTDALTTDIIVDALLGTGLDRDISGLWCDVIKRINENPAPVLSIDIPSGLNADTGSVMGTAVKAASTITFIGMKRGLLTGQAADHVGELHFADLDVPAALYAIPDQAVVSHLGLDHYRPQYRPRQRTAHKGQFGHVLIIGGDQGYLGAVLMAATAAARCGAGLVTVATHNVHAALVSVARPELMSHAIEQPQQLMPLIARATVIVIGPGLGQSLWARNLLATTLETKKPLVVDADGLNLLAQQPQQKNHWILTPHPGEAARLLDVDTNTIQADRFAAANTLQKRYQGVLVLKGSGTITVDEQGALGLCSIGNPGMASGGMGDVLSGLIAGLIAQGHTHSDAANSAVCIHAAAADHAARQGERGMLASDLMPWLRRLVNPL